MENLVVEQKNVRLMACPRCKKSTIYDVKNPNRPFCSERCKLIDTAAWADGEYRIASPGVCKESLEGLEQIDSEDS